MWPLFAVPLLLDRYSAAFYYHGRQNKLTVDNEKQFPHCTENSPPLMIAYHSSDSPPGASPVLIALSTLAVGAGDFEAKSLLTNWGRRAWPPEWQPNSSPWPRKSSVDCHPKLRHSSSTQLNVDGSWEHGETLTRQSVSSLSVGLLLALVKNRLPSADLWIDSRILMDSNKINLRQL